MRIHNTSNPAKEAGDHINQIFNKHQGDIVCLLSGGSVLEVTRYIKIPDESECRTIFIMGDERVSRGVNINNYLQLQALLPNSKILRNTIPTVPEENENSIDFAVRIEKTFLQIFSELKEPKIISLLGVGEDGHVAGIFPLEKAIFYTVYKDDRAYVPVPANELKIDYRASFTPSWMLMNVDEIIAYLSGKPKQIILESLIGEQKEIYERPAELLKEHKHSHIYTDTHL